MTKIPVMSAVRTESNSDKTELFCVKCFASEKSSSWGGQVVEGHCLNCGAGGTTIQIPTWAVEEIRKNASWVGKRYYPATEDLENQRELKALRERMTEFPGRSARCVGALNETPEERALSPMWEVKQSTGEDSECCVYVRAATEAEALAKAKTQLPYVPSVKPG